MSSHNCMKECVGTTRTIEHLLLEPTHKGTTGPPCIRTPKSQCERVTIVNAMHTLIGYFQSLLLLGQPLALWGIDIMGIFPIALAQKKFLLVATDYFTKQVEAEAFAIIKDKDVTRFLWNSIICHFGIPRIIISNNESQFDSSNYIKFCANLGIRNLYSLPRYHRLTSKQK